MSFSYSSYDESQVDEFLLKLKGLLMSGAGKGGSFSCHVTQLTRTITHGGYMGIGHEVPKGELEVWMKIHQPLRSFVADPELPAPPVKVKTVRAKILP